MDNSELNRDPRNLNLPGSLNWPQPVRELIDLWDTLYSEWDDAQANLHDKADAVRVAVTQDANALTDAVSQGKPDPGTKATEKAKREVIYWEEATKQARRKANALASKVMESIEEHRTEIIEDACEQASAGADTYSEDIRRVLELSAKAIEDRNKAYEGLRFVSKIVGPSLSFEASFPVEGAVSVPATHENRVRGIVTLLRKLILRGELSPDDSPE